MQNPPLDLKVVVDAAIAEGHIPRETQIRRSPFHLRYLHMKAVDGVVRVFAKGG